MGMIVFGLLCLLGFVLSMVGNIIGLVQAFQESATWGLIAFFVPFGMLVFVIKFWSRTWVSRSFLMNLGGALLLIAGLVGFTMTLPPELRDGAIAPESDNSGEVQGF
ncbi:MAG: hypothetical protein HC824_20920 [Synechococcales cyanobacterium RM1_1_8]|nr:hypothetical protein [Synechococcales cyanobacterium RM1_1_8]